MRYIDRLREKCDLAGLQEEELKAKEILYNYLERQTELDNTKINRLTKDRFILTTHISENACHKS